MAAAGPATDDDAGDAGARAPTEMAPVEESDPRIVRDDVDYSDGSPALRFTKDGAGFLYYRSKDGEQPRVAGCVAKVNAYQNKFYFYDNCSTTARDSKGPYPVPKTLLCAMNERIVGFVVNRNVDDKCVTPGLVCSKDGASIIDEKGNTLKSWLWDSGRQGAGTPPKEPFTFTMNRWLTFKFTSRTDMTVTFNCDGVEREFQMGERFRRTDTYMDKAVPAPGMLGKKVIVTDAPSLQERTRLFNEEAKFSRMAVKPDSRNIRRFGEIKDVMAGLEEHFSSYERRIETGEWLTKPFAAAGWRDDALARTLKEVPQHRAARSTDNPLGATDLGMTLKEAGHVSDPFELTGDRAGPLGATGRTVLSATGGGLGATQSTADDSISGGAGGPGAAAAMSGFSARDGKWLGELDIKKAIAEANPVLERSTQLRGASGRYCIDVPVENKGTVFRKLPVVRARNLDRYLDEVARPQQLVLVACLRDDDPLCRRAQQLLEHVNGSLASQYPDDPNTGKRDDGAAPPNPCPYRIIKVDMQESREMTRRFAIHALPMFLSFCDGKLCYAGPLGGAVMRMPICDRAVNYLVLEPSAKHQMQAERVLRAQGCSWDLAIRAADALAHVRRLGDDAANKKGPRAGEVVASHAILLVSADCNPEDVKGIVAQMERRKKGGGRGSGAAGGPALCGETLVVAVHECGRVKPFPEVPAAESRGRRGGRKKKTDAAAVREDLAHQAPEATSGALCSPRSGLVSHPTADLLLGGVASVAMVRPFKRGTVEELSKLWWALRLRAQLEGAAGEAAAAAVGAAKAAHVGLTHDDVLAKMHEHLELGKRGQFIDPGSTFGLSLSASDTAFRGVTLIGV